MTSTQFPVILTTEGAAASNEDVVGDNVSVVNAMYRALLNSEEIAPNALRSYFVDFYLAQALDGGFAQYVFMSPDRSELDVYIREGLEAMDATGHLELLTAPPSSSIRSPRTTPRPTSTATSTRWAAAPGTSTPSKPWTANLRNCSKPRT